MAFPQKGVLSSGLHVQELTSNVLLIDFVLILGKECGPTNSVRSGLVPVRLLGSKENTLAHRSPSTIV